jgi:hypothetical protein
MAAKLTISDLTLFINWEMLLFLKGYLLNVKPSAVVNSLLMTTFTTLVRGR